MKKYLLTLLAMVLGAGMVQAHPVSVSQAKYVGQQFVQAKFDQARQSQDLTLVYTGQSNRGEACFYVFNVGETGFVMVSADDLFRPIVGYSSEGTFDAENINPELGYMLNGLINSRSGRSGKAAPMVKAEWDMVMANGNLISRNGGRGDTYLVETKWNQDAPYNLYAPAGTGGPGGRCYAGCCATAMSQVMRFWNHPAQGTGSHSYSWHGQTLSANFGATTYDWANMPITIGNSSPQDEKEAIATLMYHCGVSVNMNFAPDGSGAYSADVPGAISSYFGYSNQANLKSRDSYTYANWANMLKESFDMGWPLYYNGQSNEGGHAFVCDGYNDADLFHYNWGWSGSGDGWFDFDEMDYAVSYDGAIFNFVPTEVYNNAAQAPTNLTVTPASETALSATLTWTNPTKTLNNSNLGGIEKIVILRSGEVVTEIENPTPGAAMTYVDNAVPRYDAFKYQVYAVYNGTHGKVVNSELISFGPTCNWTIVMTSTAFQGWRGGAIHVYNASGTEVATATTTSSSATSVNIAMPLGYVSFGWSAPTAEVTNMGFTIKDGQNTVYSYSGSTNDLEEGIFFSTNNGCGNSTTSGVPSNLVASLSDDNLYNINVSWQGVNDEGYGYTIYRDGLLYRLIPDATSFVDENVTTGGHCYYAGFLTNGGENGEYSNESCANAGEGCAPATGLDYEQTSSYKTKLKWQKPVPADGLSGFIIYRKAEGDEYQRIKLAGSSATSYTDNSSLEEGHYYYKVVAYYQDIDCSAAPAAWVGDNNQYYLHVYYSPTGVEELESGNVAVYPNPTNGSFMVEAEGMTHITVYNMLGQVVYSNDCNVDQMTVNLSNVESGIYMVRVETANGEVNSRINVIR